MPISHNFDELCEKESQVKDKARELIWEWLREKLSDEDSGFEHSQVGNFEESVCLGLRTLADGTQAEVCVNIGTTAKDFAISVNKNGKIKEPYERLVEADNYEAERAEAEQKKREAEEQKARNKALEEEARKRRKERRENGNNTE